MEAQDQLAVLEFFWNLAWVFMRNSLSFEGFFGLKFFQNVQWSPAPAICVIGPDLVRPHNSPSLMSAVCIFHSESFEFWPCQWADQDENSQLLSRVENREGTPLSGPSGRADATKGPRRPRRAAKRPSRASRGRNYFVYKFKLRVCLNNLQYDLNNLRYGENNTYINCSSRKKCSSTWPVKV